MKKPSDWSARTLLVAACAAMLMTGVTVSSVAAADPPPEQEVWGPRDPWLRPFDANSIWNTPIGTNANFAPTGYPIYSQGAGDAAQFARAKASDPTVNLHQPYAWRDRCNTAAPKTGTMQLPHSFVVADAVQNSNGSWKTPNNNGVVLGADGRTLRSLSTACRDQAGGPLYGWSTTTTDIYSDGVRGGHGASSISAFGGAIREGELTGSAPIAHVLDLVLYAKTAYMVGNDLSTCFRWPASRCDAYADKPGDPRYSGTNPEFRIGSLLAIPKTRSCESLGLESPEGAKLCWAMQHYGGYWTEDSAWDANYIQVEANTPDYYAFNRADVRRDLGKVVAAAQVVTNNRPDNVGGGGQPLAPRHVNQWESGKRGTETRSSTTTPTPTTTVPAPTTTVPAPTTTVPAPTTTVPAPATTVPAPTTTVPAPTLPAPTGKSFADWLLRTWIGPSWVPSGGTTFAIQNERFVANSGSGEGALLREGRSWDGRFDADITPSNGRSDAGIAVRATNADNMVFLSVSRAGSSGGHSLSVWVRINGTSTKLTDVGAAIPSGSTVRAGLEIRGDDIMVHVGNSQVAATKLSAQQASALGNGTLFGVRAMRTAEDGGTRLGKLSYTP